MASRLLAPFFCIALTAAASAQLDLETIVLRNGTALTGEVIEIGKDSVTLAQKVGRGSVRQGIKFKEIATDSLYATLVSSLAPLDADKHGRIAEVAFERELFSVARRHWQDAIAAGAAASPEIQAKIESCSARDCALLLERSRTALDAEQFTQARNLAMLALRRYPDRAEVKDLPDFLETITRSFEEARKRRVAFERNKKAKAQWEQVEKWLDALDRQVARAQEEEARGLTAGDRFRDARSHFDAALRHLESAERSADGIRQSAKMPLGLRPRLGTIDEDILALEVRVRLHVASIFTVRGSYGTALAYVNGALAFDPSNDRALAARARIEEAAALASTRLIGRLRN